MNDLLKPWRPGPDDPFDIAKAGHLLRRAAFGGSLAERRRLVRIGVDRAVGEMFAVGAGEDVDALLPGIIASEDVARLRSYRLWRLLHGPERLRERMSYFWHGHFATSNQKVNKPGWMVRHWDVFDRHGLGRFDDLLLAISRDPAMLRWLDNETNVKGAPNENYAREIFELFALGRGNYSEQDIKEAARAFTGWHVRDGRFHLSRRHHDTGAKNVFGQRGKFGGEDIVALTVARPESARFIARKLLEFFVHPTPTDAEVDALQDRYVATGRHIGDTLRTLLSSRLFFSARAWRSRIKDPVDLTVGLVRSLGARAGATQLERASASMGQTLCEPPSVEGWHRERAWITSATWLLRSNFAAELFAGRRYALSPGLEVLLQVENGGAERARVATLVLHDGVISDSSQRALERFVNSDAARGPGGLSALVHAVQDLPEGQLL